MKSRVDGIEAEVDANTAAVATKAEASIVSALAERLTTAESNISANTSTINSFVSIPADDIVAMFNA